MNHLKTGVLFLLLAIVAALGCTLQTVGQGGEGGARDSTPPTVSSTDPKGAATDVAVGAKINAVFSKAMNPSTLTGTTFTLTHGGASVPGAVTYSGGAATFTPVIALALGTLYTATVTTGAADQAGNALAANHTWSFTTRAVADTTPPTVISTSPAKGEMNVVASSALSATFSEALDPSTITTTTFTVTKGGSPISGAVAYAGKVATFTPSSALALDGSFLATVSTAVKDLAGNALATKFTWTFTTASRPTVTATNPVNGGQGAALNSHVEATFSVTMNPASITGTTFFVTQGMTPVVGTVTYAGTIATFAPTVDYLPSTTLTATVTTGAKDLSGNALGQDHVWSFQTGTKAGQAPVALGLASPFAVLAGDIVANTVSAGTLITGDLGISPGTSLTGFPPGVITGGTYKGAAAAGAQADLLAAYSDAAGRPGAAALPADVAGLTFTPGIYGQASAVTLSTGNCTLDAQGDANAVFIFQIGTVLSLAASTKILLIGGARATNVFWVVGSSATLGSTSKLKGTILATTGITMGAGAAVEGRLLAHGASVTLDNNSVTVPAP